MKTTKALSSSQIMETPLTNPSRWYSIFCNTRRGQQRVSSSSAITSKLNIANGLTKTLSWILHNRHARRRWWDSMVHSINDSFHPSYRSLLHNKPLSPISYWALIGGECQDNWVYLELFMYSITFIMTVTLVLRMLRSCYFLYTCTRFWYTCQPFTNIFWAQWFC